MKSFSIARSRAIGTRSEEATLAPGFYIYCGSARGPGGIAARLARHIRRDKKPHWHVDQLTAAGTTLGAWVFPGGNECAINARLAPLPTPVAGFGSSDCRRCRSHLRLWPLARLDLDAAAFANLAEMLVFRKSG